MLAASPLRLVAILLIVACGERLHSPASAKTTSPFRLADSLRDDGRFLKAHPLYRALRDSFALIGDSTNLWRAQLWWAYTLTRNNRTDSAQAALTEAMSLAKGDSAREGWTRLIRCARFSRIGQSDSAIADCDETRRIAEAIQDRELQARAHFQLGTIHSRLGHFRISVAETETTLVLQRRYRQPAQLVAGTLNSMGIEYAAVGRLGEAEQMYKEGIRLADSLNNIWTRLHLESNLAYLRYSTGDPEQAVQLMTASLRGAEQLPDTQAMVYAHNSLAEFYLRAGNRVAARKHLERSLAMNQRVTHIYRVIALADLGMLEAAESPGERAEKTLLAALSLADSSDFGLQRAGIRASLARLAVSRGKPTVALRWANAAVSIADSLSAPEAQIDALEARAAALEAARRSDASDGYLKGIELLESWRGRLALGDLRMGVAEPRWGVYEGAIRTLLARGRVAEAFMVAERARARLLLEVMAERDASRGATSPLEQVRQRLRARFEERGAVSSSEEQEALDRELARLTDSLSLLETRENAGRPTPASVEKLQAGLLPQGRSLLTFFWGDSAVYGWWMTRETLRSARLGPADSLGALADFLRSTIDRPANDSGWMRPARRAFAHFVAPLNPDSAEEVLIVADGPLAQVPLEVLIPRGGGQPWGATARFIYGPSASVLLALVNAPKTGSWERVVLALGSPTERSGGLGPAGTRTGAGQDALAPLPYAGIEARAIYELFRDQGADLLLGTSATRERWFNLEPSRYRYLHFAAHARVSDRRPEETHLVLSGGNLDLAAIRRLRLRADLVTLSACETALGRRVRGEGMIGLPHAFLAAGARGAVVTLWRIADRSAADFMRDFYAELHATRPAADALMAVRRRWIAAGGPAAHPSHWAPFVLVGGFPN